MTKIEQIFRFKIFNFFVTNCYVFIPRPLQVPGNASSSPEDASRHLKTEMSSLFSFLRVILAPWIRIRIPNADRDPGVIDQFGIEDTDTKHCPGFNTFLV